MIWEVSKGERHEALHNEIHREWNRICGKLATDKYIWIRILLLEEEDKTIKNE